MGTEGIRKLQRLPQGDPHTHHTCTYTLSKGHRLPALRLPCIHARVPVRNAHACIARARRRIILIYPEKTYADPAPSPVPSQLRMRFTRSACNVPAAGRVHSRCVRREIRESGRRCKVAEKICCGLKLNRHARAPFVYDQAD